MKNAAPPTQDAIAALRRLLPALCALGLYLAAAQLAFGAVCPLQLFAGVPCPACGLTRAALYLARGQFGESLRMHPFLLPVMAWVLAALWVKFFRPQYNKYISGAGIALLLAAIIFYTMRMANYFPHTAPMIPHENSLFFN